VGHTYYGLTSNDKDFSRKNYRTSLTVAVSNNLTLDWTIEQPKYHLHLNNMHSAITRNNNINSVRAISDITNK
uniref:Uncharacterized protein n=1 Tax=Onchocerca volvulus TaxID=6282 RepID=A0A8R1TZ27_ONCVO